ncbi:VOC family protein [Glutamicibacter sp. HZAU]|uniref:VOC family protein n=1 Tax=Glutamicibacter sp. HZAU TaxID=2049891 RepID=UPI000FFC90E5|nr:VOC family protein [Glutamicibacter sp. HZAU]RWZ79516.1 VOC family protein [Glutamicibacter sp. HZAU]
MDKRALPPRLDRVNLICLGVRDLTRSREFYRDGLGFETPDKEPNPEIVFFNCRGTKLELYELHELAEDINATAPPEISDSRTHFGGITLAYNAHSKEEVDAIFAIVEGIGGQIAKHPETVSWGGYSGYFRDPDGYYWEVAYAESWKFDENEMLIIE